MQAEPACGHRGPHCSRCLPGWTRGPGPAVAAAVRDGRGGCLSCLALPCHWFSFFVLASLPKMRASGRAWKRCSSTGDMYQAPDCVVRCPPSVPGTGHPPALKGHMRSPGFTATWSACSAGRLKPGFCWWPML